MRIWSKRSAKAPGPHPRSSVRADGPRSSSRRMVERIARKSFSRIPRTKMKSTGWSEIFWTIRPNRLIVTSLISGGERDAPLRWASAPPLKPPVARRRLRRRRAHWPACDRESLEIQRLDGVHARGLDRRVERAEEAAGEAQGGGDEGPL